MRKQNTQFTGCLARRVVLALWMAALALWTTPAHAQAPDVSQRPHNGPARKAQAADDPAVTMFPHSQTARYWISGQDNIIFQYHPSFHAKYSGPNSLTHESRNAISNISTLFLGYQLRDTTEVYLDVEEASGGGLSDGLGLA